MGLVCAWLYWIVSEDGGEEPAILLICFFSDGIVLVYLGTLATEDPGLSPSGAIVKLHSSGGFWPDRP